MLNISQINLLGFNQNKKIQKKNQAVNNFTIPNFKPQYKYNLNADTVSFKGGAVNKTVAQEMVLAAKKRAGYFNDFKEMGVNSILAAVTERNFPFLQKILQLGGNALTSVGVVALLDYANNEETNLEELDEKIVNYNELGQWVNERGFTKSILSQYIDKIPSKGVVDLIKSDVLLNNPKAGFNSFSDSYNYAVYHFNHEIKKDPNMTEARKESKAAEFMRNKFANVVQLARVFDGNVCNELLYNRGGYVDCNYMPRLKSLNNDDMDLLRKVQTSGVTTKENKGGDLSDYPISMDDKITMLNLLAANREIINAGYEGLNFHDYVRPVNIYNEGGNVRIDFQGIKINLMDKVLRRIGIAEDVVDRYSKDFNEAYEAQPDLKDYRKYFWDTNYGHLLNAPKGSLLRDIVVNATNGDFEKFIYDDDNDIAKLNKINREKFEAEGIDFEKYLHPRIKPRIDSFTDRAGKRTKTFIVKNWDRVPQESLLDGNYTTCCTGLDKDQGDSFLDFMTKTNTTTLEVRTDKNKVVAMSRILFAKIDGKLSMVVENIEVNNKMAKQFLYNDESRYRFREMIFDYAREYAKHINKNEEEMPVYFCAKYYKVKDIEKGLEKGKKYYDVELVGEYPNNMYINAFGGKYDKFKIRDDGDEFSLSLSNISEKAKPVIDANNNIESDHTYNHQDTEYYNQ